MSKSPSFQTVLLVLPQQVKLFQLAEDNWQPLELDLTLDQPVSSEAVSAVSGQNTLVLVSDDFAGHLQFTQENKKAQLERSVILEKLEDEYEIDTMVYHLDWQTNTVNRQLVQLSVTGLENEIIDQVTKWLEGANPKKLWIMPIAWFSSVLKSIDPALIAIIDDGQAHVSHHYLGIDDARVLNIADLPAYVQARQEERPETHLVYLAADSKSQTKVEKELTELEGISVQPLFEEAVDNVWPTIISEVLSKGLVLSELWHLVREGQADNHVASKVALEPEKEVESETILEPKQEPEFKTELEDVVEKETTSEATPKPTSEASLETEPIPNDLMAEAQPSSEAASLPVPTPPPALSSSSPTVVEDTQSDISVEKEDATKVHKVENKIELKSESKEEPKEDSKEKQSVEASQKTEVSVKKEVTSKETITETGPQSAEQSSAAEAIPSVEPVSVLQQLKGSGVKSSNGDRYLEVPPKKRSWWVPILVFLVVAILTAVIAGAVFWSQEGAKYLGFIDPVVQEPTFQPTPTPELAEESPTATAEAELTELVEVDKTASSILVLNATGIPGLAGKNQTMLTDAGWEEVEVGNATGAYADANFVTGASEAQLASLQEDLEIELRLVEEVDEDQAANYDIVIILAAK